MASVIKSLGLNIVTYLNGLDATGQPYANWNTTRPAKWRREMQFLYEELTDDIMVFVTGDPDESYSPNEVMDRCSGPFNYTVPIMVIKRMNAVTDDSIQGEHQRINDDELDMMVEFSEDLSNLIWGRGYFDGQSGCRHEILEVDLPTAYDALVLEEKRVFLSLIYVRMT